LFLTLGAIAVLYALLAGLRTVSDNDLPWQMATGRWVAQHHSVFSTDVFSYTAYGQPWVYPVGSGLFFYAAYLLGGWAMLSWIGAIACAGTVALLLRRGSLTTAALAILAVPLIAYRTVPRADMFTVVLFAACLSLLWENYRSGRARLWLLPLLMVAWVNLHLGFIAGLALIAGFAGLELLEMLFPGPRRDHALQRLRREWPWFALTLGVTVLNPWGWGAYTAVLRQDRAMVQHARWLTEWFGLPLNWTVVANSLALRSTNGAVYWILGIAMIAVLLALLQRQFGAAILLIGACYETIHYIRMEALTACIVVLVGGAILHRGLEQLASHIVSIRTRRTAAVFATVLFALLACLHSVDLVSGRHYFIRNDITTFGAGIGWWYPQQAVDFLERAKLPGNTFNTLDEGGFLVWRMGNGYRDYIDGRSIPFGLESFEQLQRLLLASLDSPLWQQEADRYHIVAFILPLARVHMTPLVRLKDFCNSQKWSPVYLDEVSVIFVRRMPETEALIQRSGLDCATATLPAETTFESRGMAFNRWANAAAVLEALGRPYEALAATDKAQAIFADGGYIHWLRGNLFAGMGRIADSESELLKAVAVDPNENSWASLGILYQHQGKLAEAKQGFERAVGYSLQPHFANLRLAHFDLSIADPHAALQALDDALAQAPAVALAEKGSESLRFQVARSRADTWHMLGNLQKAVAFDEEAVQIAPSDASAWADLARLYALDGRTSDQQRAEKRAAELVSADAKASAKQ
jgi:tetratricopeptide (TPR) repeat protein